MRLKLVVVAVVIALIAAVAFAGPNCPGKGVKGQGPGCVMGLGKIAADLQLTQDQVGQFKALCADCMKQTESTREQIKLKMNDMAALWAAEAPDAVAIKALAAEIDVLKADIRNVCVDKMIAALSILTAEQRAKLREIMKSGPGCGLMMGCGMGAGGCGMGPGAGCCGAMGPGQGRGMGPGKGNCPFSK